MKFVKNFKNYHKSAVKIYVARLWKFASMKALFYDKISDGDANNVSVIG